MSIQNEQLVDWAGCIAQFQASGQSAAAWCLVNNIKAHQLHYRLHRANNKETDLVRGGCRCRLTNRPVLLIKVGTAVIEVTPNFDPALLRAVVRALSTL